MFTALDLFLIASLLACGGGAFYYRAKYRDAQQAQTQIEERLTKVSSTLSQTERDLAVCHERLAHTATLDADLQNVKARCNQLEQNAVQGREALARADAQQQEQKQQRDKAERTYETLTEHLESEKQEVSALRERLATLTETLEQERRQSQERLSLLTEARQKMSVEFKSLAEEVMTRHGETFTRLNKQQVESLLTPVQQKIVEFQQNLQKVHVENSKERATLAEQIRNITETGTQMSAEARNLVHALKNESQTQGAWGEMVLSSILEKSGLREGEEYSTQHSVTTDEGNRLRPDVVVNLPGEQKVIIDSKVSLRAFESYTNTEDTHDKATYAQAHGLSMRSHIKNLSGKAYQALPGVHLDYVIMFVPIEGALALALQEDPSLTTYATDLNVAIATPTTLMIALRTIAAVWSVERRNANADEIATLAGRMYDKMVGFVEDIEGIGKRLDQARKSYDGALGKLCSGNGNLLRQAERIREKGGKASKSLPKALLNDDTDGSDSLFSHTSEA